MSNEPVPQPPEALVVLRSAARRPICSSCRSSPASCWRSTTSRRRRRPTSRCATSPRTPRSAGTCAACTSGRATLMIAAVVLHQMRVFFTGAYRAAARAQLDDRHVAARLHADARASPATAWCSSSSATGARPSAPTSATRCRSSAPFMKQMLLGGDDYNDRTLSRFFILHARRPAGDADPGADDAHRPDAAARRDRARSSRTSPQARREHFNFFPDHFYTELIIGLSLMILLSALATLLPVEMGPRADPLIDARGHQAGVVLLRRVPLAEAVLGHDGGAEQGFIVFVMFCLAVHRRLAGPAVHSTRTVSVWIGIVGAF